MCEACAAAAPHSQFESTEDSNIPTRGKALTVKGVCKSLCIQRAK